MEINGVYSINSDYKSLSRNSARNRRIMVDVVIVDLHEPRPLAYLVRDEVAELLEQGTDVDESLLARHQEPFSLLGEVIQIDRDKRLILLINENTVDYKHLILARGAASHQQNELEDSFSPGLHMLAAALRMQREQLRPSSRSDQSNPHKPKARLTKPERKLASCLLDRAARCFRNDKPPGFYQGSQHRVYEVQL